MTHTSYRSALGLSALLSLSAIGFGQSELETQPSILDVVDFEGFPAGTIVDAVYGRAGYGPILVSGRNPALGTVNAAVIFDSANPTGGDPDLGTPNQAFGGPGQGAAGGPGSPYVNRRPMGNLIVIAKDLIDSDGDGLVDDPGDADEVGATLEFDFSAIGPVAMSGVTIVDVEDEEPFATLEMFDSAGTLVEVIDFPQVGDNGIAHLVFGAVEHVMTARITVNGSAAVDNLRFTPACTGLIGDFVWHDLDRDGLQDLGEPGIEGVRLERIDLISGAVEETITLPGGLYQFDGLCRGRYEIVVDESTLPPTMVPTGCQVGGDPRIDSNCSPARVFLRGPDQINRTIDFGFVTPCSGLIGDFVWHDVDRDGVQGLGEPGLEGVKVELLDPSGLILGVDTTGPGGAYEFNGLCAGDYVVSIDESTLPPGFTETICNAGSDSSVDSDCSPVDVTLLTHDAVDVTIDFGFIAPCDASIGDRVWHDVDENGIQDLGETGLEGVKLDLADASGGHLASTTTGPGGLYAFTGLCAGAYSVTVDETTLPPGFVASVCFAGNDLAVDSNCSPAQVILTTDSTIDTTIDFGYHSPCPGRIGDFVWLDLDGNHLQDPGEQGIAGVRVLLEDASGAPVAEFTTGDSGYYEFGGLCPGEYRVQYDSTTVPGGLGPVLSNMGSDDSRDSDTSPTTVVLTAADPVDLSVDFGFAGCGPCDGKINGLTMEYTFGAAPAVVDIFKKQNGGLVYSALVEPGDVFTFGPPAGELDFGPWIDVYVNGVYQVEIHTSCSQPLGPGMVFGEFTILAGSSRNGGVLCEL